MAKEGMSSKLYKNSPEMKRDEESGKMAAKKPTKAQQESSEVNAGVAGIPIGPRHAMDRHALHSKHETEHMIHDHGAGGSKKELHSRHAKEMADMHKRHEKESTGSGDGKEKISKVQKGE